MLLTGSALVFSQQAITDSLSNSLKTEKDVLTKFNLMNKLCQAHRSFGNNDSALYYGKNALSAIREELRKQNKPAGKVLVLKLEKESIEWMQQLED